MREIVIFSPLVRLSWFSEALTSYHMGIGIQQNNQAPLPSSAIRGVARPSPTLNDGMTGTRRDSVQLAREYARMSPLQLSYIQPPSFVGFSEYPSEGTNSQLGNVGRGGMCSNSSLANGGFKIAIVFTTSLIC
jgi:hypothetical protein